MKDKYNIVDSHVHLDLIQRYHPEKIPWLKNNGICVVSWSYFEKVTSMSDLEENLNIKSNCLQALSKTGLDCFYLAGIHPRSIPPDLKPELVEKLLQPYMEDPQCRGIGEIGLEVGDSKEKEVLLAQLEFSRTLNLSDKVIGIHSPRADKAKMTQLTLDILKDFSDLAPRLLIDHCSAETVGSVLEAGFRAGVTVSSIKTSWKELQQIISNCSRQIDRILCNTDSGSMFFEDLVRCYHSGDLSEKVKKKIFLQNAASFFSLY